MPRTDVDGSPFIQVNFLNKKKVLITKKLIGFKPVEVVGLDSQKIPKVVTTLDLRSIRYAIEELLDGEESYQLTLELDVLKKVYQSIMMGAEEVGFDVQQEKSWFFANMLNSKAISA